jgi:hypothetical protein
MFGRFIERRVDDGIRGACEGLFPENDFGAPDFRTTDLARRTREWMDELPPPQRRLLVLLFFTVELLTPILLLVPARFSRLSPERRAEAVRRWRRSRFFFLRLLGDALKASTTMIYMSHPLVVAHIGEYRREGERA